MVDSCIHCKFHNGAWRTRAAFQDRVLWIEDRIIYIDEHNFYSSVLFYSDDFTTILSQFVSYSHSCTRLYSNDYMFYTNIDNHVILFV